MNKKIFGRKLSRSRPAREALFAGLTRAMILNGKIETTKAKAKAVQPLLEKTVSLAKKGDIASRRRILAELDNAADAVSVLFKKVVPAFSTRKSGYTRIIVLPRRSGDNAEVVRIEWTEKIDMAGEKANPVEAKKEVKKAKEVAEKGGKGRRGTKGASSEKV